MLRHLRFQHLHQRIKRAAGIQWRIGLQVLLRLLHRQGHSFFIKRLEQVVHRIDLESPDRILVEGGGKDNLRQRYLAVNQLLDNAKTVEAWHLDVKKNQVGGVLLDQVHRLHAVLALRKNFDIADRLEQVG